MRKALSIGRVVLVYLLLGLVTTWAVAWGLALLPPGISTQFTAIRSDDTALQVSCVHYGGIGSSRISFETQIEGLDDRGLRVSFAPDLVGDDLSRMFAFAGHGHGEYVLWFDPSPSHSWGLRRQTFDLGLTAHPLRGVDDARGFPALALWCGWRGHRTSSSIDFESLVGGIEVPGTRTVAANRLGPMQPGRAIRALPYYPIWSGLALNTAFYALLFFAVVRTTRGLKHARRYRRGVCPKCRYDRLFDYREPCPECGHAPRVRRGKRGAVVSA